MEPKLRRLTNRYATISALVSAATHPVPAVDEIIVVAIHYHFSAKVVRAREAKLLDLPWWRVNKIIWGGAALRFFFDLTFGIVPVAGAVAHATSAAALTEVLGRYLEEVLRNPGSPPPMTIRALRDSLRRTMQTARAKAA